MGDISCRKCGAYNPPIKRRDNGVPREATKIEKGVIKTIRIIDKDTVCGLCGGEIDWIMG